MKKFVLFLFLALLATVSPTVTTPIDALGTTLPSLSSSLNYRVFNDLMKQSLPIVPYQFIWGGIGRHWGFNLTFINGQAHQYPASLPANVYAVAEIPFYPEDDDLVNQTFDLKFAGAGVVGVYQQGLFNLTWGSSTGGNFTLKAVNQSLFVYIYLTSAVNPVNSISILSTSLPANPSTFTSNFLNYLAPFNLLRTCFWQGQNLYNSGKTSQIWANRTLPASSTQISPNGVALEHILQLENYGITIWPCIPDTADSNYITQMATLFASNRNQSNILYLQFGNVYTIMNDVPDKITNPAFDTFMTTYGATYRNKVLFTINYRDIQYYINAMGGTRATPYNFTYIDAIGAQATFGIIDATKGYGLTDAALKKLITHMELTYETTLNTAYQQATFNGTTLVMFSGGPYLKVPRYGWAWKYSQNTSNLTLKTLGEQEIALQQVLLNMNFNDTWVQELYLHWIARVRAMGVKTVMYSQLVGQYINNTDIVPLLPNLNSTTQLYNALKDYALNNKVTALPLFTTLPANPFTCSPACVWGDCVNNVCACYAGYSGADCSVYTPPNTQNRVGMNLQGLSYWTTQTPFIDLHREGSAWVYFQVNKGWSSGQAYKNQVPLDSNGYPTYLPPGISVGTLMARDVLTHYDSGTYVVLYEGEGILTFGMYDVVAIRYGIGRVELDVVPSTNLNNGILVTISRTNPTNHIRNIRVIRPGFEGLWQAVNFHPLLLQKLQPFGTLRFMDWTNTNGQTDSTWESRTLTSYRTYTGNGVAWEQCIRLANTLGKNVWINIPHLATDDYVLKLAQLFYDKLEPHLKVYVEYSNEVWGSLFPGGIYSQNKGVTMNLAPGDPTEARFCYLGLRTNQISTIWRGVYGSDSRLNMIVSTQSVNADTTKRILACQSTYNYVDGVAIAPYLSTTLTDNITYDQIITQLQAQVSAIATTIQQHLLFTTPHNLSLHCYESGQGLVGSNTAQTTLQIGVQTYPPMRALYLSYLEMLFNNSISLANHFGDTGRYSQYGSWGLFQNVDDNLNISQKWLGVSDYFKGQNFSIAPVGYGSSTCTNNCSENGVCAFGMCSCYSGYGGSDCSVGKFVDFYECGYLCTFNQGTCGLSYTIDNNRYYSCTCFQGYTGATCSIAVCPGNCSFAGTCSSPGVCSCYRGKMGTNCELDCGCGGHGICNADQTCKCDTGFNFNSTSGRCEFACNGLPSSSCSAPNVLACSSCVSGTCNNGVCTCWPGFSGSDCSTESGPTYVNPNLGVNLGGLSYWSTQHLFKDYFKQSSVWISHHYPGYFNSTIAYTWNTNQAYPTLPNGYPKQLYANMSLGKLLLRDLQLRYPSINQTNKYVLLYDGDGIIQLGMDATQTEYSAGRIKFTVAPSTVRDNGVYVRLLGTNPSNPIQNIRVVLERDEYNYQKDLLTDNFMTFIQQFSTIRFMDLLGTNGSPVKEWADTTLPNQDTQAMPTGISIELLTKIISRTGRNPWINVPHLASDDYVTKLASYLKANLPQGRTIYVEYSNEVWNSFFEQGKYAIAQAAALGLTNYHKFYAMRSLQIFNIFTSVFGDNSRLRFVISYQAVSKWVADQILTYSVTTNGVTTSLKDQPNLILAGAPYYDCNNIGNAANTAIVATETVPQILQTCMDQFSSLTSILQIASNVSASYGNLPMAAYESGTSISQQQTIYNGNETPGATINFIATNRDPGIYDVYKTLLSTYKQNNLATTAPMNIFSSIGLPSKYGSWGVLDYMDQVAENPTHPKFQAILDFNQGK